MYRFGGVITECTGDDLTVVLDGWSLEFACVVDKHSSRVMPFRYHSTDDRQSNSIQLLQPCMSVYIRSGIGWTWKSSFKRRNGGMWHHVQIESVDFAKRECVIQDGLLSIPHYPIVFSRNLFDSVGHGEYSASSECDCTLTSLLYTFWIRFTHSNEVPRLFQSLESP